MPSVISPAMEKAVGREISRTVSYPVSASDIRRWAIAAYWPQTPPSRFLATDESDLLAPEDLNPFAWSAAEEHLPSDPKNGAGGHDPDSTERKLGIDGPGLRRQLNGGLSVRYGAPMRVGDTITSRRILSGYRVKEGGSGPMLFTTMTDTWTNQDDALVKTTDMTLIRY